MRAAPRRKYGEEKKKGKEKNNFLVSKLNNSWRKMDMMWRKSEKKEDKLWEGCDSNLGIM